MSHRLRIYGLVVVLAGFVVGGLVMGWMLVKQQRTPSPETPSDAVLQQLNLPVTRKGSTIQKRYFPERKVVQYEIEGTLSGNFVKGNVVFISEFLFKNDPLKRPIKLHLGYQDGSGVYLGRYSGDFLGGASWARESWEGFVQLVGLEREVRIFVEFVLEPPEYSEKIYEEVKLLDSLVEAESRGAVSEIELPANFALYAYQVGMVVPHE